MDNRCACGRRVPMRRSAKGSSSCSRECYMKRYGRARYAAARRPHAPECFGCWLGIAADRRSDAKFCSRRCKHALLTWLKTDAAKLAVASGLDSFIAAMKARKLKRADLFIVRAMSAAEREQRRRWHATARKNRWVRRHRDLFSAYLERSKVARRSVSRESKRRRRYGRALSEPRFVEMLAVLNEFRSRAPRAARTILERLQAGPATVADLLEITDHVRGRIHTLRREGHQIIQYGRGQRSVYVLLEAM